MGSILPCCLPYRKAGGLQIQCCQGIKVTDYIFTLDALVLKPSDFCNIRVKLYIRQLHHIAGQCMYAHAFFCENGLTNLWYCKIAIYHL